RRAETSRRPVEGRRFDRDRDEGALPRHRCDDAACRGRDLGGGEGEHSRARRSRRQDRRPPLAPSPPLRLPLLHPPSPPPRPATPATTTTRRSPSAEFFKGLFETPLEPDQIIPKVQFPKANKAAYVKFPNPASRYALVGVFVSKRSSEIRVAVTGAGANGVFR